MLFNSGDFFFFFILVYLLYVNLPHRGQNILLLIASYFFYGYWDVRFLGLIFISTVVDYVAGITIHEHNQQGNPKKAKTWMLISVMVNLGILGTFKYFNFFAESLTDFAQLFGWEISYTTLNIILPAGISFYTFQTMSYSLDIYRGQMKPTRHFFDFALFVSFFPQLMAGPIERAKRLLPQIQKARVITSEYLAEGGWLILWGLFKKVFIADNLAPYSFWNVVNTSSPTSGDLYIGIIAFSVQFYCDFSGYSDMARGLAYVMGFKLTLNFNLPFTATNPAAFWQKWHITLSSWLRDYVYAPIVRSRLIDGNKFMALVLTMAIAGFWHGAGWQFIVWGALWGIAMHLYRLSIPALNVIKEKHPLAPKLLGFLGAVYSVHIWMLVGQFFVTSGIAHGWSNIWIIFSDWTSSPYTLADLNALIYYIWPLVLMQAAQYYYKDLLVVFRLPYVLRLGVYSLLLFLLFTSGAEGGAEFIYFQF